jgi:1-acyl-sn-glycerol-3-phosphate acyltransferase
MPLFREGMAGRTPAYRSLQAIARGLFRALSDFGVEGADLYPASGPYIVVINHLHWLDLVAVFTVQRHAVAGVMKKKWEGHPLTSPITRHVGNAIVVDPTGADPRGIGRAKRWLDAGGVLLISPEGTRSKTGAMRRAMRGTAFLASRTGAPVVPTAMWGQERLFRDLRHARRPKVHVRVGRPIRWEWTSDRPGDAELDAFTDHVMATLADMLPAEYRGAYADLADVAASPSAAAP